MSLRKRVAIAVVGASALGLGVASAATLGGLTSSSLGANETVVAACDTDGVTIAYTNAYDAATGKYRTMSATIGGMAPACTGKNLSVTLKDGTGASLAAASTAVTGATQAVNVAAAADAVAGAAVVISG